MYQQIGAKQSKTNIRLFKIWAKLFASRFISFKSRYMLPSAFDFNIFRLFLILFFSAGFSFELLLVRLFIIFILIFLISLFFISFENKDFTTNFSAIAATLNNIGPGFDAVGPAASFAEYTFFSKLVLSFAMLLGRLEIFPMIVLFSRNYK